MKKILFPDDWVKLTPTRKAQLEEKLKENTRESDSIKSILNADLKRDYIIAYWNSLTEEQRANLGKSQDEIENGHQARSRSLFDFSGVANCSWEELPDQWKGTLLSGYAETDVELLKQSVTLT